MIPSVVGLCFSNAHIAQYDPAWNNKIWERRSAIMRMLERMKAYGHAIEGSSPWVKIERNGLFGRKVVKLECIIHFPRRLSHDQSNVVKTCVEAIMAHLIEAGARMSDVQRMIIGNVATFL